MFFHHFGIESFGQDINVREISPLIAGRIVKGKMEREKENVDIISLREDRESW